MRNKRNAKTGDVSSPRSEEGNLEQYGVWVKVKPEDVEEKQQADEEQDLPDFDTADDGELSLEEEDLLQDLEDELNPADLDAEDIDFPEEEVIDKVPEEPVSAEPEDLPDLDLDELEDLEVPEGELSLDEEISAADFEDEPPAEADLASAEQDVMASEGIEAAAEELPAFDLDEMDSDDAISELEDLDLEEGSLEEELPELEVEEPEEATELAGEEPEPESEEIEEIDDVGALERELVGPEVVEAPSDQPVDFAESLKTITNELRQIKSVLSELREDLVAVKQEQTVPEATETTVEVEPPGEETKAFFGEDEDETIALTGTELDNILETAEITEEQAATPPTEPQEPQHEEPLMEKEDVLDYDLLETETDEEEPLQEPVDLASLPETAPAAEDDEEETAELEEVTDIEDEQEGFPALPVTDEWDEIGADEDLDLDELAATETIDEALEQEPEVPEELGEQAPSVEQEEVKSVLKYLDQLLGALPEEKIQEFARSEQFQTYKRLFRDLGLKK